MRRQDRPLVTREMVGLFVVFGADLILVVVLLAAVGVMEWIPAIGVTAFVLAGFGSWVAGRWYSQRALARRVPDSGVEERPLETLKRRYATGELSEAEFEKKLETLLDSQRRVDSRTDTRPDRTAPGRDRQTDRE